MRRLGAVIETRQKYMCGRLDNLFEAADSGDILAHPRITSNHIRAALFPFMV